MGSCIFLRMNPTNQSRGEEINKKIQGTIQIVAAVGQAIADLGSVPSGHLYAHMMGHMDLESFNNVIGMLKKAKLVEESNHLLTWVGPKLK